MDLLSSDEVGEIINFMDMQGIEQLRLTSRKLKNFIDNSHYFSRLLAQFKDLEITGYTQYKMIYTSKNFHSFVSHIDKNSIKDVNHHLNNGLNMNFIPGFIRPQMIHSMEMLDLLLKRGLEPLSFIDDLQSADQILLIQMAKRGLIPLSLLDEKVNYYACAAYPSQTMSHEEYNHVVDQMMYYHQLHESCTTFKC